MTEFQKATAILDELFGKDCTFSLATCKNNVPTVRIIDAYYDNGSFWVVTYGKSNKVQDILQNPNVSMCSGLYKFNGRAYHAGHPLDEGNKEIREKLTKAFEKWYFAHNNEDDENMCYVRIDLDFSFFFKDGTGYCVTFPEEKVDTFPFENYIDE